MRLLCTVALSVAVACVAVSTGGAQAGQPKHLLVTIVVKAEGTVSKENVAVGFGPVRTYVADPDLMRIQLLGPRGRVLKTIKTWDPLRYFVFVKVKNQVRERYVSRDSATMMFPLPFHYDVRAIRVGDSTGRRYGGEFSVTTEVTAFCTAHRSDAGCRRWLQRYDPRRD